LSLSSVLGDLTKNGIQQRLDGLALNLRTLQDAPGSGPPQAHSFKWFTKETECQEEREIWLQAKETWTETIRPLFKKELDRRTAGMEIEEDLMQAAEQEMEATFPNIWSAVEDWRTAWSKRRIWASGYSWIWRELDQVNPLSPLKRNRRHRVAVLPGGTKAGPGEILDDQKGIFDKVLSAMVANENGKLHFDPQDLPTPATVQELEASKRWTELSRIG